MPGDVPGQRLADLAADLVDPGRVDQDELRLLQPGPIGLRISQRCEARLDGRPVGRAGLEDLLAQQGVQDRRLPPADHPERGDLDGGLVELPGQVAELRDLRGQRPLLLGGQLEPAEGLFEALAGAEDQGVGVVELVEDGRRGSGSAMAVRRSDSGVVMGPSSDRVRPSADGLLAPGADVEQSRSSRLGGRRTGPPAAGRRARGRSGTRAVGQVEEVPGRVEGRVAGRLRPGAGPSAAGIRSASNLAIADARPPGRSDSVRSYGAVEVVDRRDRQPLARSELGDPGRVVARDLRRTSAPWIVGRLGRHDRSGEPGGPRRSRVGHVDRRSTSRPRSCPGGDRAGRWPGSIAGSARLARRSPRSRREPRLGRPIRESRTRPSHRRSTEGSRELGMQVVEVGDRPGDEAGGVEARGERDDPRRLIDATQSRRLEARDAAERRRPGDRAAGLRPERRQAHPAWRPPPPSRSTTRRGSGRGPRGCGSAAGRSRHRAS